MQGTCCSRPRIFSNQWELEGDGDLSGYPAGQSRWGNARRVGWSHARGNECAAGAGLYQNRRDAGCDRPLHPAVAAGGVRRVRFLALSGGGRGLSDGSHPRGRTVTHGPRRERAVCGPGSVRGAADGRLPAAGAAIQARLPRRLPLTDGTRRISHRRGIPGRYRGAR